MGQIKWMWWHGHKVFVTRAAGWSDVYYVALLLLSINWIYVLIEGFVLFVCLSARPPPPPSLSLSLSLTHPLYLSLSLRVSLSLHLSVYLSGHSHWPIGSAQLKQQTTYWVPLSALYLSSLITEYNVCLRLARSSQHGPDQSHTFQSLNQADL